MTTEDKSQVLLWVLCLLYHDLWLCGWQGSLSVAAGSSDALSMLFWTPFRSSLSWLPQQKALQFFGWVSEVVRGAMGAR